jgi:hypothetical protein
MDRNFALCNNENSDTVGRVPMLLYNVFGIVVMIEFGTTVSKCRAKSEDMSSMFEIVGS